MSAGVVPIHYVGLLMLRLAKMHVIDIDFMFLTSYSALLFRVELTD